jgi:tRNA(Ile2) C34 agmatinyltransferase TiaS
MRKKRDMVCPACGARMSIYGPSDRAWHIKCPKRPSRAPAPEYREVEPYEPGAR